MAFKIEMNEVLRSTEVTPSRRPAMAGRADPPELTNRRRMITGVIVAGALLAGAMVWQYVDGQSAPRSPAATAEQTNTIGSVALTD